MPTTNRRKDYLGMALINPDPGVSDAVDYLGRDIGEGDTDYMGRSLLNSSGGSQLPAEFPIVFEEG